jgi:hypothetical protein
MTYITRAGVADLRKVLEDAMNDKIGVLGLQAQLGRITFVPGSELRVKLTVVEKPKTVTNTSSTVTVRPRVGESWLFSGKLYIIEADNGAMILMNRPSRARSARYIAAQGLMCATYRVKTSQLMATGEKIR